MPKIHKTSRQICEEGVKDAMVLTMSRTDKNVKEFAQSMRMARSTMYLRMDDPGEMKLKELWQMQLIHPLSDAELLKMVKYR